MSEGTTDSGIGLRWRDVTLGAVLTAGDLYNGLLARAQRRRAQARERAGETLDALRLYAALLGARGAGEEEHLRQRATERVTAIAEAVATSPVVDRMIDAQLDRTLRPLITKALDDILALLEEDPDRLRSVISGQRDSMVDELLEHIRDGASAGDAAVDRMTARVLGRTGGPAAEPP
jgi:hypothetical protein